LAFGIGRASAIRLGARVDGMMQQMAQRRAMGPAPDQRALVWTEAHALWHAALMLHEIA
jgi:hypothetical protein